MSFAGTCAICVGALSRRSRQIPVLGVADAVDQVHDAVTGAGDSGAERGTENGTVSAPGQLSQQLDVSTPRHAHPGTCPGQRDVHRSTWLQRVSSGDCPALRLKWATMRGPLTGAVAAPATLLLLTRAATLAIRSTRARRSFSCAANASSCGRSRRHLASTTASSMDSEAP